MTITGRCFGNERCYNEGHSYAAPSDIIFQGHYEVVMGLKGMKNYRNIYKEKTYFYPDVLSKYIFFFRKRGRKTKREKEFSLQLNPFIKGTDIRESSEYERQHLVTWLATLSLRLVGPLL